MPMTIGLLLFDDAEELDWAGPWEVFTMVREVAKYQKLSIDPPNPVTVSERGGTIRCAKGLRVITDHSFADCPRLDVLLIPGGQGTRREVENKDLLRWVAETAKGCKWVTSVCTGSLILTAAGPARGKRVTTHWGFVKTLRERGEASEVLDNARYVRDGNVVTSAGVSAGIDMSLWLVGQIYSPAIARMTQRGMEYDPAPPYTAEV
jgi:transcriptional regulator GlxA family with amidase domain